jgi:hypothetical protein
VHAKRHDRILAAEDIEQGFLFKSSQPALDDYLPFDSNSGYSNTSKVLGVTKQSSTGETYIEFGDAEAYAALAQAIYLLSRVTRFVRMYMNIPDSAARQEATLLDNMLQTLTASILRQAGGGTLHGKYCTASMYCLMSVFLRVWFLRNENTDRSLLVR